MQVHSEFHYDNRCDALLFSLLPAGDGRAWPLGLLEAGIMGGNGSWGWWAFCWVVWILLFLSHLCVCFLFVFVSVYFLVDAMLLCFCFVFSRCPVCNSWQLLFILLFDNLSIL